MTQTLIVVDNDAPLLVDEPVNVISFDTYLAEFPKVNEPKTRVINLCDTSQYLSRGYYCSLLAEARQHRVLPSVTTINALREAGQADRDQALVALPRELIGAEVLEPVWVFFGVAEKSQFKRLAKKAFDLFPVPILVLTWQDSDSHARVKQVAYSTMNPAQKVAFLSRLHAFTRDVWRQKSSHRQPRWEMAILVNPQEQQPPSDGDAIKRFIKAAAKVGIRAETITAAQAGQIGEYDALFIRETTAIDHQTYRIACKAEQEGLVVMDDPNSILRCCNKVFLHDAFTYSQVPSPKTKVVSGCTDAELDIIEQQFSYPLVLKLPEGAFSLGVFKVENRNELLERLSNLLKSSALVLVQEFLYTEFDWRIGVLNGRAIYACRYHMARKHWQIYNHDAKRFSSGGFETLPTFEVPRAVLNAAIKACAIIGRGLYGVDIKQKEGRVYVIEVNDNPSIEHGIEDKYLGNELYMQVMQAFADRLEMRGRSQ